MTFFAGLQLLFLIIFSLALIINEVYSAVRKKKYQQSTAFKGKRLVERVLIVISYFFLILIFISVLKQNFFTKSIFLQGDFFNHLLVDDLLLKLFGATLAFIGFIFLISGYYQLNSSHQLVTNGIYALSRNPIFLGLDFYAFGTFLINGQIIFFFLILLLILTLHFQIQNEEKFLKKQFGKNYLDYQLQVKKYL